MLERWGDELQCFAMRSRRLVAILAHLGAAITVPCLAAAIATADDERSGPEAQPPGTHINESPAAATTGHRAIDLLLEMGDAPEAADRPRADAKPARAFEPKAAASSAGDDVHAAALTASSVVAAEAEKTDWGTPEALKRALQSLGAQSWRGAAVADPAREDRRRQIEQDRAWRGVPAASGAPPRRSSLFDLPVVRYIREHRLLVLAGATAALALVWGAATFSFHRRRR